MSSTFERILCMCVCVCVEAVVVVHACLRVRRGH